MVPLTVSSMFSLVVSILILSLTSLAASDGAEKMLLNVHVAPAASLLPMHLFGSVIAK